MIGSAAVTSLGEKITLILRSQGRLAVHSRWPGTFYIRHILTQTQIIRLTLLTQIVIFWGKEKRNAGMSEAPEDVPGSGPAPAGPSGAMRGPEDLRRGGGCRALEMLARKQDDGAQPARRSAQRDCTVLVLG